MRSGLFLRAVVSFIGCQLISAGLLLSQQEDPAEKLLREIGQAVGAMPLQGLKDCRAVIENLNEEGVRAGLNDILCQFGTARNGDTKAGSEHCSGGDDLAQNHTKRCREKWVGVKS